MCQAAQFRCASPNGRPVYWATEEGHTYSPFTDAVKAPPERDRGGIAARSPDCEGRISRSKKRPGTSIRTTSPADHTRFLCRHLRLRSSKRSGCAISPFCSAHRNAPGYEFSAWSKNKVRLNKLSGVTDFVIHDLRRAAGTNLVRLGVHQPVRERVLNHVIGNLRQRHSEPRPSGPSTETLSEHGARVSGVETAALR